MARKRCDQRAGLVDGATRTTTPTTLHARDLQKVKETSRATTAFDENHAASPRRKTLFSRFINNMKGLLCVNRNPTTEESVDENVNELKKEKTHFWQKGRRRGMKMPRESERLEELHVQNEKLTKDLKPTSSAVFFMEQDIEQHAKHRQEQHIVVQLEQVPRKKRNEEQVHSMNDFLQQNAIEDIKEHNEKIASIRRTVEWLKEGQDGHTQAVQQVKDFIKRNQEQMFHVVELEQHLEEVLQANKDEGEGELLENLLMNPIEPAGKQDCPTFQQGQLLKEKRNEEVVRFENYCLQQNATEEDIKQHNVELAAISGTVEWLKEGQERVTQSLQQVKDIKRLYQMQSSRVVELERRLKEALQVKYLKTNEHFNDGKRTHLWMEHERIVKKEESFRVQWPKRLFEAAGRGATKEHKTLPNTRNHEETLLKIVLLQQQRLAWAKRNNFK